MKYAAGCFGCLALMFLALTFGTSFLIGQIAQLAPEQSMTILSLAQPLQYVNGGCCCLSGVLAIALFAVGSMGNKDVVE
jgi:hypothetical protein